MPVIRNHLYDMFQLFDYNDASVLTGDRNTSTIAPQALFLMNSELVAELALALADRLLENEPDTEQRIDRLYLETYGRTASAAESSDATNFLTQFRAFQQESDSDTDPERLAWQALCQAIVSSSEFVYLR